MLNSGPLSDSLLGYTALLATNQPDAFGSDLFYNIYPPHVISGYRNALSDLGAEVSVCSLERAIQKLSNPILDKRLFVVNMCTGFNSLESESAIQAVASLSNILCFPCRGDIAVITEEKIISKHLARTAGLRAPETYRTLSGLDNGKKYIRKRVNSGDSKGIRVVDRIGIEDPLNDCEYVEPFISGFDIELFCLFDPLIEEYILLGAIVADWGSPDGTERIQSTEMKSSSDAFVGSSVEIPRWIQVSVTEEMICCINKLGVILHNTFLFRIDGRQGLSRCPRFGWTRRGREGMIAADGWFAVAPRVSAALSG